MSNADILTPFAGGIRLTIRAKPGLSRSRTIKIVDIGDGKRAVEVSVAADAREGKANKALIERLAKELGLTKKQISIKSGETGRLKIVEVVGDPAALSQKIAALLGF
ncbi:MAG: DUF167 domain-containing protein [Bdellovibrionales bacterium]